MKLFKKYEIIPPTREALEKSIKNNLKICNTLQFIFFGILTIYAFAYIRLGEHYIYLLITDTIISVFIAMYLIIHKIDKARLELFNATNIEDKEEKAI